jgi:hypothetical protein
MKKIPTLYKREFSGHKITGIRDEITPGCETVPAARLLTANSTSALMLSRAKQYRRARSRVTSQTR